MKSKSLRWLSVALLVIGITLTVLYRGRLDVAALQQWIQQAGAAGPLLFMLIYAIGTVFLLPGSVLTLAGGALFGPVWGTLWNLTAATLGGALAFLAARYLGAEWVERRAGPKLKRLTDGVAAEGWRFVAFVRLVPLFPFNLLNYALGLTRIAFVPYLLVLDVRAAADFVGEQGHLAVALNLPLEQLPRRVEELELWMEQAVMLVCRTDRRSAKAAAILTKAGFSDVHVVHGGMTAWLSHGWPVEEVQLKQG